MNLQSLDHSSLESVANCPSRKIKFQKKEKKKKEKKLAQLTLSYKIAPYELVEASFMQDSRIQLLLASRPGVQKMQGHYSLLTHKPWYRFLSSFEKLPVWRPVVA